MQQATAFGFREWPFRIVVDEDFARVWADRSQLRQEIERRVQIIQELPHSTVQLIWADFGAGKSHTLRYLEAKCRDSAPGRLFPIYVEVPPDLGGLQGLFQRFGEAFPDALLRDLGKLSPKSGGGTIGARDLRQALRLFASNDPIGLEIAREWLSAIPGTPNLRTLKSYGINSRIEDDSRVVEVIVELVRYVRAYSPGSSVVWLVDEYQRLADVKTRRREGISQALVSLFNACPTGLHLILSLSVAQQSAALALLPQALRSRASTFPLLTLPFLSHDECMQFVRDLLGVFRLPGNQDGYFPFTEASLAGVVGHAELRLSGAVTPRSLMETLSRFLLEIYMATSGEPPVPLSWETAEAFLVRLSNEDDNGAEG